LIFNFSGGTILEQISEKRPMLTRILIAVALFALTCCRKDPVVTAPSNPSGDSTNTLPDTTPVELQTRIVAEGLNFPWEILWGPGDKIWFTERGGSISTLDVKSGEITPILTVEDVYSVSESGLLGMAIPSDLMQYPFVFIAYTYKKSGENTLKVVRYDYHESSLSNPLVILDDVRGGGIHNGCRLLISSDNKLFVTTGDSNDQSLPQDVSSKNGKILRINFDGSAPSDNPIAGNPVWSYGHRNAQGLVFVGDSLFSSEHGPDTDDEVNMIHKGGNYGWPNVKGDCDGDEEEFCAAHNVIEPLTAWTPTIAPSGMEYYSKDEIPQWKNSLLLCTLKDERLIQLKLDEQQAAVVSTKDYFVGDFGRLRDACISPDGKVYLCTSNGDGADKIIESSAK
jgi:glucose/arabinose dehydrogenase